MNILPAMRFFYMPSVESTQSAAIKCLKTIASDMLPFAVCAGVQQAGKGKGARTWEGGVGNIAISLAVPLPESNQILPSPTRITIGAGLALHHMIATCFPAEERALLRIKWPNDLYRDGKKIAGILTEIIPATSSANRTGKHIAIVGIGLNIASSPKNVPESDALHTAPMPLGAGFAAAYMPYFMEAMALDGDNMNDAWLPLSYPQDGHVIYKGDARRLGAILDNGALLLLDTKGCAAETITDSDGLTFPTRGVVCC